MFQKSLLGVLTICGLSVVTTALQPVAARSAAGPFAIFNGSWMGAGTINMTDGGQERIRCRASYATSRDGSGLQLGVRCASDSYKLDVAGQIAAAPDGGVTGSWSEATHQVSGDVVGRVPGPGQLALNLNASLLTIQISVSTSGSHQTIALRFPGTSVDSAQIAFRRS